jgi:integrase/recombinase XerC
MCDCRKGKLCLFHESRPEVVVTRFKAKGGKWADATGFAQIHDQALALLSKYKEQKLQAYRHCGSCWATLKLAGKGERTVCPSGCECHCEDGKTCYVHFGCSCVDYRLCKFHKDVRPDVVSEFYRALPPNDAVRRRLGDQLVAAGIDRERLKAKQPSRREKKLEQRRKDIRTELQTWKKSKTAPTVEPRPGKSGPPAKAASAGKVLADAQVDVGRKKAAALEKPGSKGAAKFDLALELESKLPEYEKWLSKQRLSHHSVRTYLSRIKGFISILRDSDLDYPLLSPTTKDIPVRDLKKHLKKAAKVKPATLNSYLAAVDNFYGFLGLGKTDVVREDLPQEAPQALSAKDQKKFLRAVELARRPKDRAIAALLFYTGMRLAECANLELDDVFVVGRNTRAIVRSGKGDRYREVPLNSAVCDVMQAWLAERKEKYAGKTVALAVFLNPQGNPMAPNAIYEVIRKIGRDAGIDLSPHTLRHTCLTALIRKQNDVILVADIAGHKSLNTTRRYSLPTVADKAKALEGLLE